MKRLESGALFLGAALLAGGCTGPLPQEVTIRETDRASKDSAIPEQVLNAPTPGQSFEIEFTYLGGLDGGAGVSRIIDRANKNVCYAVVLNSEGQGGAAIDCVNFPLK